LKIEIFFLSLSKPATTTKMFLFLFYFIFCVRADVLSVCANAHVRADAAHRVRGRPCPRGRLTASARMLGGFCTDAVFTALADGKNPFAGKTASTG
jgi:hypothetical protein